MLQIEYNGKFLKTAPGTSVEFERNSPLFQLDVVLADFTMPITLVYCEENVEALGDLFFEYGLKSKKTLQVNLYDDGSYFTSATMVINKSQPDLQSRGRSYVQGFFLTGVSDYFQAVKDKKLSSLTMGGTRRFNFTTWDPWDSSDGFWQHFHSTWDGNQDYAMVPHRNDGWIQEEWFDGWVNQLGRGYNGGLPDLPKGQVEQFSWVVLFPRLKYVLECMFTEFGWKLDTTGIGDTDWEKLFLFSTTPITTTRGEGIDVLPMNTVTFQVSKLISPEIYVSEFLLAICSKYGWAPLCDSDTKTCRLVALKSSINGVRKDFTEYATGKWPTDFSESVRKFSYTIESAPNDAKYQAADFTNYTIQQPVFEKTDLPTPTVTYDNSLVFCFKENAFFKVAVDEDLNRTWVKHSDNIFDEQTDGATDEINTKCSTLPMQLSEYREDAAGVKYYGFFPDCSVARNKEFGIRTLFYHGMVKELKADGTEGPDMYPLASSVCVIPNGDIVTNWSNVLRHTDGEDKYGIIDYWLAPWLKILQVNNTIEMDLRLPLFELSQLKWDDIINIRNQEFLIKKYIEPRPYRGMIRAYLHPLLLDDNDPVLEETAVTYYVKLFFENVTPAASMWWTNYKTCTVIARVYSDAAGTNLVIPNNPLQINIQWRATNLTNPNVVMGGPESHTIGQAVNTIYTDAMYEGRTLDPVEDFRWDYVLLPGTGYTAI